MQTQESIEQAKLRLRARLLAGRRDRDAASRLTARAGVTTHLIASLGTNLQLAAFYPLPTEPLDPQLLDQLAITARVLVPVVTGAAPLDWCEHPGPVRRGDFGISEPLGPRLGPEAIAAADAVLLPALAVDRNAHRLGRGGGHYDRTLALLRRLVGPDRMPPLIALIYDDELLDQVPFDSLDQRVSAVVTPSAGLIALG